MKAFSYRIFAKSLFLHFSRNVVSRMGSGRAQVALLSRRGMIATMKSPIAHALPPATLLALARRVLAPERAYFSVTVTYTVAISLLTLALPISIQMLIDSVANTALPRAVATLAIVWSVAGGLA